MRSFKPAPAFAGAASRFARRPSRYVALLLFSLFSFIIFFLWKPNPQPQSPYYDWHPPAHFPPIESNKQAAVENLCENFPAAALEKVQVVLRTGTGDHERLDAQLASISSCIPNLLIFSDLEERYGTVELIDILAYLPESYRVDNPDFEAYTAQIDARNSGYEIPYTGEGWKLDKFKFLPMIERTYDWRPFAEWYVFIETDSYIFWDTMFRLLSQYDPKEPHLLGAPVPGSHAGYFPYSGAGIVMSNGLMKKYMRPSMFDNSKPSEKYESWVRDECCGDITLANVILDRTGIRMKRLWPTFNGEELIKVQIDRRTWCVPLLAMHRLSPEQMTSTWRWERTRFDDGKPVLHSTLLYHRQPYLNNVSTVDYWDNLSDVDSPNGLAHTSSVACQVACQDDPNCFQYSYSARRCRFAWGIKWGKATEDKKEHFISGWDVKKIRTMGFDFQQEGVTGCEKAMWERPETY